MCRSAFCSPICGFLKFLKLPVIYIKRTETGDVMLRPLLIIHEFAYVFQLYFVDSPECLYKIPNTVSRDVPRNGAVHNNNNNNNNKLQMGCRPVAVVVMHVHKYEIRI